MKKLKKFTFLFSMVIVSMMLIKCGNDSVEPTVLYTISGTVTYPNFTGTAVAAPGAVVYLQIDGTGQTTAHDMSTIADASGNYTFKNLLPGNYFVFASYNSNNTNISKAKYDDMLFSGEGHNVEIVGADVVQAVALKTETESGTVSINTTTDWNFDFSHSNVVFGFPYDVVNAEFIGQFTGFDIDIIFDQANLSSSSIVATVDLTTVDTGQPGRDGPGTCIQNDFGVERDVDTNEVIGTTGTSTFTSTSIEKYGNGYLAIGNLVFMGKTVKVNLFFTYVPGFEAENRSGILTRYSSFQGTMEFEALNDFGFDSSHVGGNNVTIYISAQVNAPV